MSPTSLTSVKRQQHRPGAHRLSRPRGRLHGFPGPAGGKRIVEVILVLIFLGGGVNPGVFAEEILQPLTDQEFFQKIDLDYPGMANVAEAVKAEDFPLAKKTLGEYYRNRTGKYFTLGPQKPGEGPEGWKKNVGSTRPLVTRMGEYDASLWKGDFFDWNASRVRNKERMYFFGSIGTAYAASGDEEIAKAWVNLMRSFVKFCPKSKGGSMWASMHVGIRMRTGWPQAFHCFIHSPSFSDDDLGLFLKSVWEQSDYIRYNHNPTSNWLTFSMAGLYTSGVMYPEFVDARDWRKHASSIAVEDMDVGWLPDGMSIELTPGYGQFFSNYYVIYDLAKQVDCLDEFNLPEFFAKTERTYELYLKIMAPDRTAPATNDNGPQNVPYMLRKALERFPDRDDFRWIVSDGKDGRKPDFTSIVLPYAGFAMMRSGWERDGHMLYFDFGPVGYRHAHQDKLEVMVWAYGRQILFDPGRVNYADTPHQNYCMDTHSHNTVLVDHRPQRRIWYEDPHPDKRPYPKLKDFDWESTDRYDYASGVYDKAYGLPGESDAYPYKKGGNFKEGWEHPAIHHRRVFFLKPDVFLVADTMIAQDDRCHEYDVRWHLDSLQTRLGEDGYSVATSDGDMPNLEIVPLRTKGLTVKTTSAQDKPEILGWKITKESEPATTLQHIQSGSGTVQFLTLLLPLKSGQRTLFKKGHRESEESWKVQLDDGRELSITAPGTGSEKLKASWMQ